MQKNFYNNKTYNCLRKKKRIPDEATVCEYAAMHVSNA